MWRFPKPLLAAINGPAVAGGMDLCVLCDFRIASANATFGHPEIKFGAPPLFTPLQWIVGMGVARDLCLTGRRIDADEALRIGLVNRITGPARVLDDAKAMARTIIEAPQAALECEKRYLTSSPSATFEEAFAVEHDAVFDEFLRGPVGPPHLMRFGSNHYPASTCRVRKSRTAPAKMSLRSPATMCPAPRTSVNSTCGNAREIRRRAPG